VRSLRAGAAYFLLVFGAGFLLGPLRLFLLVPRVGERAAELLELPVMIVVIVFAARWVVRRFALPPGLAGRLAVGGLAFVLMLAAEFGLVLTLRGLTLADYFATRDPVSGTAYYASQLFFAALPALLRSR
jgi:hypothetical protein